MAQTVRFSHPISNALLTYASSCLPAQNAFRFNFPYACPEPVLAK